MKGSLATPRRAASSAAAPRATWPSSAYMRERREAHSACAARSGLLCSPPPAQRSSNCAASAVWCRSSSRDRRAEARDRRGLRSEREVVSLQVFFGIQDLQRDNLALASWSCIQELPLLALDGQKVPGSLRCCCEVARCCRELSS